MKYYIDCQRLLEVIFMCLRKTLLMFLFMYFNALQANATDLQAIIYSLTHIEKNSQAISKEQLPAPFDYLLTQPLTTKAIESYYQSTPWIEPLYTHQDEKGYHRSIIMYVSKSQGKKCSKIPVELAFITINFSALPNKVVQDVLHTDIPFGQLLTKHHISYTTINRSYFLMRCNDSLNAVLHCSVNGMIYGRKNTIVSSDDHKQWFAKVVDVSPGIVLAKG